MTIDVSDTLYDKSIYSVSYIAKLLDYNDVVCDCNYYKTVYDIYVKSSFLEYIDIDAKYTSYGNTAIFDFYINNKGYRNTDYGFKEIPKIRLKRKSKKTKYSGFSALVDIDSNEAKYISEYRFKLAQKSINKVIYPRTKNVGQYKVTSLIG